MATKSIELEIEAHRRELTAYCYRMLGSGFEAEDAVQETMVRAWKNIDGFEGRSSLRSWLYRIATNVCLDMHRGPQRRARPMEIGWSGTTDSTIDGGLPEHMWVQPMADERILPIEGDPAELAEARDSVRLAFVAALQHLPPKQRAVLILREVLRWQATECAELLETSVASVNSALQRARATLDSLDLQGTTVVDPDQAEILAKYVDAFERYDIESLVSLLHDDAFQSMPPYALWLEGKVEIGRWYLGQGIGCRGSRLLPIRANGCPAYAQYRPAGPGRWEPWGIHVLHISGGKIAEIASFIYPELFPAFGCPTFLEE